MSAKSHNSSVLSAAACSPSGLTCSNDSVLESALACPVCGHEFDAAAARERARQQQPLNAEPVFEPGGADSARRSSGARRAKHATRALVFGILSPFGWLFGYFLIFVEILVEHAVIGSSASRSQPTTDGSLSRGDMIAHAVILLVGFGIASIAVGSGLSVLKQIRASGGTLSGRGQALTGLILGFGAMVLLLLWLLLILLYVMAPPSAPDAGAP